jgi:hypothetical protein
MRLFHHPIQVIKMTKESLPENSDLQVSAVCQTFKCALSHVLSTLVRKGIVRGSLRGDMGPAPCLAATGGDRGA